MVLLGCVHSPYGDGKTGPSLRQMLKTERDQLLMSGVEGAAVPGSVAGGVRLGDLAQHLGGLRQVYRMPDGSEISKEEWEHRASSEQTEREAGSPDAPVQSRD